MPAEAPTETYLVLYWDDGCWHLSGEWLKGSEAREHADGLRALYGRRRVRTLHTADGT
jgi:hypothetical protein